jgi:hypothetical protein
MRSTLRNAMVLIAVMACGCKEDDDEPESVFDSSVVLPSFDGGGVDASRPDSGGLGGTFDSSIQFDSSVPAVDAGVTPGQDAAPSADAGGDAGSDGGAGDGGLDGSAGDGGADASAGDASAGDAGRDGGGDAGRDGSAGDAGGDARVDASADAGATTFTRVYEIISANCSPCHVGETRGNLDMGTKETAHLELVTRNNGAAEGPQCDDMGLRRVIPRNPDDSLLVQKLRDPPCGSRMPLGRNELDIALVREIESWIAAGAANN